MLLELFTCFFLGIIIGAVYLNQSKDKRDQPTPLTEEQIIGIRMTTEGNIIAFARAIERAHGVVN